MMNKISALVVAACMLVIGVGRADAAAVRVGATTAAIIGASRGTSVSYDSVNKVYLVVSTYGLLRGRFVDAAGAPLGTQFQIQSSGIYSHFPRVAFSPDADGGRGGFLVTWSESDLATGTSVHGRIVSYASGGNAGSDNRLGTLSNWEAGNPVAYSTVSKEFLVAWQLYPAIADIAAVRVDNSGQVIAAVPIPATADGERDPSVAYNPATNQFLIVFSGYNSATAFVGARRVQAGTGVVVDADRTTLFRSTGTFITDVTYNSAANEYFAVWWSGLTSLGQRVNADGAPVGNVIALSTRWQSYDALSVAYNARSDSFFMVSHSPTAEDGGVEIFPNGNPMDNGLLVTAAGGNGNFYPRISANTQQPEWLLSTANNFTSAMVQRVSSDRVSTGPPPVTGPPTPPPPPPGPPVDPGVMRERARSDFNGDGSFDILWQHMTQGYLAAWELKGNQLVDSVLLDHRNMDNNWVIVGAGDFNGDGKPDLVWQHQTEGWVGVWYMNGIKLIDSVYLTPNRVLDTGWRIVGVGDFNGDGKADIAWQHQTQRWLAVWLMDGVTLIDSVLMNPNKIYDARWQIAGIGDFNRDGKPDLVWRHSTNGQIGIWLMDGLNLVNSIPFSPGVVADNDWKIVGIIDANGDRKPDLVWHHVTQGWVGVWYLDGDNLIDSVWIGPGQVADVGWKVVGPR